VLTLQDITDDSVLLCMDCCD